MNHMLSCLLLIYLFPVYMTVQRSRCGKSQFINSQDRCTDCTVCKNEYITRTKCSLWNDTVCESWKFFLSNLTWKDFVDSSWSSTKKDNRTKVLIKTSVSSKRDNSQRDNSATVQKNDTEQWKKLTFSLIGVLCVLVIAATVIVFVSCQKFLRFRQSKTSHNCLSAEQGDVEGDYVVIHRRPSGYVPTDSDDPSPSSPSNFDSIPTNAARLQHLRRMYRPQRRLLNEYVDDVFESEDSGGSRTGIRGYLHTIMEAPDMECVVDTAKDNIHHSETTTDTSDTAVVSQETSNAEILNQHNPGTEIT